MLQGDNKLLVPISLDGGVEKADTFVVDDLARAQERGGRHRRVGEVEIRNQSSFSERILAVLVIAETSTIGDYVCSKVDGVELTLECHLVDAITDLGRELAEEGTLLLSVRWEVQSERPERARQRSLVVNHSHDTRPNVPRLWLSSGGLRCIGLRCRCWRVGV